PRNGYPASEKPEPPSPKRLAELIAQAAGPFIGRGMRIAELNDVDGSLIGGGVETHQLFEEGHERAGLLEGLLRGVGEILLDFALRRGALGGARRRRGGPFGFFLGRFLFRGGRLRGGSLGRTGQQAAAYEGREEGQENTVAHPSRVG